jgi:hypothetical protein
LEDEFLFFLFLSYHLDVIVVVRQRLVSVVVVVNEKNWLLLAVAVELVVQVELPKRHPNEQQMMKMGCQQQRKDVNVVEQQMLMVEHWVVEQ